MSKRLNRKEELMTSYSQRELENEWSKYKYWTMSRSQKGYNDIRLLFRNNDDVNVNDFYSIIDSVDVINDDMKAEANAFEHVWGYFKSKASENEKREFLNLLEKYRKGDSKKEKVYDLLYELANKYDVDYLLQSYYFDEYEEDT